VKILAKYVLKEHVGPLTFALAALTSLLLLNYVAKNFGELVGKGLPWQVIVEFFVLSIPFTFAMTVPMAVLVAVLYAFSRLASENEITAMKASGVGMSRLLVPVLVASVAIAGGMLWFNDQVLSNSNHRLAMLQRDIFRTRPTFALKEQVINTLQEGRLYLRAGRIERGSSHMKEVVVYDLSDPTRRRTILADSGEIGFAPNRKDLFMTLYAGVMQELPTDKPGELTRLFYRRDRIRVVGVGSQFEESRMDQGKSDREMTICEMNGMVVAAERRYDLAQQQIAELQAKIAHAADPSRPIPPKRKFKPPLSLGGLYCSFIKHLGVTEAQAQEVRLGGAQQQQGRVLRDTGEVGLYRHQIAETREQLEVHETSRDRYLVEIHKKFSLAVACIVFVLVGAPVALRFPRGGVGLVIGVSLSIFALYYVGLIGGEALADRDIISPFWGMWGANVVMTAIGLAMAARMGREEATARGGDVRDLMESLRVWTARVGRRFGLRLERRRRGLA
jgi:lipopolysaccharide export system permease protein